jgi:hypothetical protein
MVEMPNARVLHLDIAPRAGQSYNGVMELVASFAAFGLLVAGWLASGRRRVTVE